MLRPKKKRKYGFDLKKLEDRAIDSLKAFYVQESEKTKTDLFKSIKELAYAILKVGKFAKYKLNYEECSYEYGVYLYERIANGTFNPFASNKYIDRFPFQFYISRNIYHIVLTKNPDKVWHETLLDLSSLIENRDKLLSMENELELRFDKKFLAKKLYRSLKFFYTQEQISRLFPLTLDLLYHSRGPTENTPEDLREFFLTCIAMVKRLNVDYNIDQGLLDTNITNFKKARTASIRSTIFLSAVVNSKFFPKEFLLALDLESLYRLVHLMGGQTLKIPTQRELDTLVGSVVAASKVILDQQDSAKAISDSKDDFNLIFAKHINASSFVSKILECYNLFGDCSDSDPLIKTLVISIQSMGKLIKELGETKDDHPIEVLNKYKELSSTFKSLSSGLIKLSSLEEKEKNV